MNKNDILIGAIGFGIGVVSGWVLKCTHLAKKKKRNYMSSSNKEEQENNDNINIQVNDTDEDKPIVVNEMFNYANLTHNYSFEDYRNMEDQRELEIEEDEPENDIPLKHKRPYLIDSEEYEQDNGYSKNNYLMYSDGVITDEHDQRVDNWRQLFGILPLQRIEAYGDNIVYVRNDFLRSDSVIASVDANYEEGDVNEDE